MSTQAHDLAEADARLEEVLADYLRAEAEGHPPAHEDLLARYPDLAEELGAFFRNRDFIEQHTSRLRVDAPTQIGDYELLEVIGSGTFGVVFKARDPNNDRFVALKVLRGEQWSSTEHVQRFRAEAKRMAKLDHDHIVPVYYSGEHDGRHYFVMKFIEGGSLAQRLHGFTSQDRASRQHQRWAAGLMVKVARAVHDAHQRAILHRDLKPGNILLDAKGNPHVADFGLAKHLQEVEPLFELGPADDNAIGGEEKSVADTVKTEKGVIVGTATYMSAEAAACGELTTASDIYSLGVVLYEMLTGQVPIRGDTPTETLRLIQKEPLPAPRSLNPRIDLRLEQVCLKCLQRNPQERYGSALGLARNLERWLADVPFPDIPESFLLRCRLWFRRYPALAGGMVTAALLLVFVLFMAVAVTRTRAARLEDEVLKSNAFAAQGVASTVLWHLERLSDPVLETGGDDLRRLLEQTPPDKKALQALVEKAHRQYADPASRLVKRGEEPAYEDWYVLDTDGFMLACAAHIPGDEPYRWRDYFDGAMRRGSAGKTGKDSIHVSRTYRGDRTKMYLFAISAPVYSSKEPGKVIGVIAATITTRPTWSQLQISDGSRTSALVGPQDPNPPHPPAGNAGPPPEQEAKQFLVVLHPAYKLRDQAVAMLSDQPREVHKPSPENAFQLPEPEHDFRPAIDRYYRDPFADRDKRYGGRWLAGFAPVGNTGYVVIVQQRYDDAIPFPTDLVLAAGAVLLGLLLFMAIVWLGFQWLTRARE